MGTEEQAAVEQFLGENPSSAQLRQWRETLRARLAEMDRQIAALEREELITEFVEDSVRVTLAMGSIAEGQELEE